MSSGLEAFSNTTVAALKSAFLRLDADILQTSLSSLDPGVPIANALSLQAPAYAGSCALLSTYQPQSRLLHVACVGDSRAVLGRWDASTSTYSSQPLSVDQTGFNPKEVARITAEHPDETGIIDPASGRVLGIAVTRAFGDGLWKWPLDAIEKMRDEYWGRPPRPGFKQPPYLTAEPEVEKVKVENGDFVIMASDGVWDHVSSEVAIRCIGEWVERKKTGKLRKDGSTRLRAGETGEEKQNGTENSRDRVGMARFDEWKTTPEDFVFEDENAATHLIKNVFGGGNRELFRAVMSVGPPQSRYLRDDVTVWVVFFGEEGRR